MNITYLTVEEAAKEANVSANTIRRHIGVDLSAQQAGTTWLISREALSTWMSMRGRKVK